MQTESISQGSQNRVCVGSTSVLRDCFREPNHYKNYVIILNVNDLVSKYNSLSNLSHVGHNLFGNNATTLLTTFI